MSPDLPACAFEDDSPVARQSPSAPVARTMALRVRPRREPRASRAVARLARLAVLASSAVSAATAQTTSPTFLPPSPCVYRLDALDAKVAALETSLGDGAPFARVAAEGGGAGGFFGAAFEGLGRAGDRVTAQGTAWGDDLDFSLENSAPFGVSGTGDRAAALGAGSPPEGDFSLAAGRPALASETAALAFGNAAFATTYLDETLRVSRGNKGSYFVLMRPETYWEMRRTRETRESGSAGK